jgi:hypothetical protein
MQRATVDMFTTMRTSNLTDTVGEDTDHVMSSVNFVYLIHSVLYADIFGVTSFKGFEDENN